MKTSYNYNETKIVDNLKYLDRILEVNLKKSENFLIEVRKLADNISPIDFDRLFSESFADKVKAIFVKPKSLADIDFNFDIPAESNTEEAKFLNALFYLHSEGLIVFKPYPENTSYLTFKGIIKISNGGFVKEYKRNQLKDNLQKYAWIVAILTFVLGWISKPIIDYVLTNFFINTI